jgi:hypothetical protein
MLGHKSALYIGEAEALTSENYVANVISISGFEKSRNMIAIEAALDEDADTFLPGKKVVSEVTFTINYKSDSAEFLSTLDGYLENGTRIYFAVTKPNSNTGKGGPGYISKIAEPELTREGVINQTITITPEKGDLLKEVTVASAE